MLGMDQSYSIAEEFQLFLATDSAQKAVRSAKSDAYFLGIALYFFTEMRNITFITQIRLEDLQLFQIWLSKEQAIHGKRKKIWGDTTVEFYTRILKKFFRKMFDTDRITKNPCRLWKVPRGTNKVRRPLTNEEVARIYAASDEWFKAIFRFMNFTGARGASIAMLTWADVDFKKRILVLKSRKGGLKQMKTIPHDLFDEFYAFMEGEASKVPEAKGPVFWSPRGTAVTAQEISSEGSRLIRKVLKIDDREAVLYSTRHKYVTDLLESGASLEVTARAVGHSSVTQTSAYAKRLNLKVVGEAVAKIRGGIKEDGK